MELSRYVDDAIVPIDNNETEQLMRQVALGRKNWLFAGSVKGGERTAGFFTLVSSALRNDLDVWRYVNDVLEQLLSGVTDYAPLLPRNWAQAHPDAVGDYRAEELKERAERKSHDRADRRRIKQPYPTAVLGAYHLRTSRTSQNLRVSDTEDVLASGHLVIARPAE